MGINRAGGGLEGKEEHKRELGVIGERFKKGRASRR